MEDRLINFDCENVGPQYLSDAVRIIARDIEDSLIGVGAKPGKDYTYRDLYTWAMPLVLENAKSFGLKWMYQNMEGQICNAEYASH